MFLITHTMTPNNHICTLRVLEKAGKRERESGREREKAEKGKIGGPKNNFVLSLRVFGCAFAIHSKDPI